MRGRAGVTLAMLLVFAPALAIAACNPESAAQPQERVMDVNTDSRAEKSPALSARLRSLLGAKQWLNTPPLRPEDLQGKVVLVNFWTYSCINSLRPLPYLRAWAEKYKERGLVVIGVHTPEFAFERDLSKVQTAVTNLPVGYPVVLDSDHGIWNAFNNNAWPGFYYLDAEGRVRHRVLGEGGYDEAERMIQKLLSEASGAAIMDPLATPAGEGAQAPPDWENLRTPETYVGFERGTNFSSPGGMKRGAARTYAHASSLSPNHWSLSGAWMIGEEYAEVEGANGKIAFRFHARDLHLVLGNGGSGPIRFRVTIDGKPPGANHGADIDAEGWGRLEEDRMYQLIRQSGPVMGRTFEIEFMSPDARAYSFTFG